MYIWATAKATNMASAFMLFRCRILIVNSPSRCDALARTGFSP
jgi:hypothetical protein